MTKGRPKKLKRNQETVLQEGTVNGRNTDNSSVFTEGKHSYYGLTAEQLQLGIKREKVQSVGDGHPDCVCRLWSHH